MGVIAPKFSNDVVVSAIKLIQTNTKFYEKEPHVAPFFIRKTIKSKIPPPEKGTLPFSAMRHGAARR